MSFPRRAVFALFVCLATTTAWAWGPLGHEVVAELAQRQLNPVAAEAVQRLLGVEGRTRLRDVANWPDQMQDDPQLAGLWRATRKQHYINFRGPDCTYVPPRDCRDGQCVVGGLAQQVAVLADHRRSDAERLQALKFVVHFVGDVHQPLHAGYRDDRGGNLYQVQFNGRGSNLHRVWDSGLIGRRDLDAVAYADWLTAHGARQTPAPVSLDTATWVGWARESCRITARPGFYPAGHKISRAYVAAELPVAEQRLRLAGHRLADVLDTALAP